MSCLTGATGTTRTKTFTQDRRINIIEEFRYAVEKDQSKFKKKQTVAYSEHLQDCMDAIKHQPSKWEDMEYSHMAHTFWSGFATYLVHHARNK